jgi:hypothetical protein
MHAMLAKKADVAHQLMKREMIVVVSCYDTVS